MHKVIDDFAPAGLCRAALAEWPDETWPHWFRYTAERGDKLSSHDADRLTPACAELMRELYRLDIGLLLRLPETFPDLGLYGAGMSMILSGGELPKHLDGDHNPVTGWFRAASAVLFLHPCDGGELCLWDSTGTRVEYAIRPKVGRLVLFECNDQSWHSVAKVRVGRRLSLSCFYWRLPTGEARLRPRAEFSPVT